MKELKITDLDEHTFYVINKIEPNLHNLTIKLWPDTKQFDVDFYFKDDPRKDEEGYMGCGLEEFIPHSPTHEKLTTIMWVLKYCLDLKWDDE